MGNKDQFATILTYFDVEPEQMDNGDLERTIIALRGAATYLDENGVLPALRIELWDLQRYLTELRESRLLEGVNE